MQITKGFKYRIYPTKEQALVLDHQCFIYNQAYNICLNIQKEQWQRNKDLEKKDRSYLKASEIDSKVKYALKQRALSFKAVVAQQARINANRALEQALKLKNKGFPRFKNSKLAKQSFNWTNQGYQFKDYALNPKFKIFKLMSLPLKLRYHRILPKDYKLNQITVTKNHNKYFLALSVTYNEARVQELKKEELKLDSCIGIDLNIDNIALSNGELIKTHSKGLNLRKYDLTYKRLQRKQAKRVLRAKKEKIKLSKNFKKTQKKLNSIHERSINSKKDNYHKISTSLIKEFDLIVVEDLQIKNMTKRAKLKNVKAKSGLNRSILNTSFYQFTQYLEYKAKHNGKFLVKVNPQYTSKTCSMCDNIKENLSLTDRVYICDNCNNSMHRDTNASINILKRGLESFGLGISLEDYKLKAFRVS